MELSYHPFHWPVLSPATRKLADRPGSKTNKTRMFVCRGRSSFKLASFGPAGEQWDFVMIAALVQPDIGKTVW